MGPDARRARRQDAAGAAVRHGFGYAHSLMWPCWVLSAVWGPSTSPRVLVQSTLQSICLTTGLQNGSQVFQAARPARPSPSLFPLPCAALRSPLTSLSTLVCAGKREARAHGAFAALRQHAICQMLVKIGLWRASVILCREHLLAWRRLASARAGNRAGWCMPDVSPYPKT